MSKNNNNRHFANSQSFDSVIAELERRDCHPKPASGDNWMAKCPFHEDKDRDFSLHPQKDLIASNAVSTVLSMSWINTLVSSRQNIFHWIGWLKARGFPVEYLKSIGWSDTHKNGKPLSSYPTSMKPGRLKRSDTAIRSAGILSFPGGRVTHILPYV